MSTDYSGKMKKWNGTDWDVLYPKTLPENIIGILAATQIPSLDASKIGSGTIDVARLPAIALTNTLVVTTLADLITYQYGPNNDYCQEGDVIIATSENKTYIHNGGTAGTSADFTLLRTPTDIVTSVAGKVGEVTLIKNDVGLENVQNYPIASVSEAEAGSRVDRYMNPQVTKSAIYKQVASWARENSDKPSYKFHAVNVTGVESGTTGFWTASDPDITAYTDGLTIALFTNGYTGGSSGNSKGGSTLNINGMGQKNIYYTNDSKMTTHYGGRSLIILYYNLSEDRFYCHDFYYSEGYNLRWESKIIFGEATNGYHLLMEGIDGKMYPVTSGGDSASASNVVTNAALKPGGKMMYYNSSTNITANSTVSTYAVYEGEYSNEMEYWSNKAAAWATPGLPFYIKVQVQSDGSFKIKGNGTVVTDFLTQTLPITDDGYVYIQVGFMNDEWDSWRLQIDHPMYEYKEGKLRNYIPSHTHALPSHQHQASDINAGTLGTDRIPSLDASKINAGTFNSARIPSLDASKINAGTLGTDRLPYAGASAKGAVRVNVSGSTGYIYTS